MGTCKKQGNAFRAKERGKKEGIGMKERILVVDDDREIVKAMGKRVITMNQGVVVGDEQAGGSYED